MGERDGSMEAEPERREAGDGSLAWLDELPAASSLLSSRFTRDNLVTSHPGRLYDGRIRELVGLDALKALIASLEAERGSVRAGATRIGVHTWSVSCTDGDGPFVLEVPLALDEVGTRRRAKRDVPRLNVENMRALRRAGLTRYLAEPRGVLTLGGNVPAAIFQAFPEHHPVTFGSGSLRIELVETSQSYLLSLGAGATADLLAELVAALAYHYDADEAGGTAITDVCVNDGDFVVRRRRDGSFDLRLTAVRRREGGISSSLLLLYLVQLMAYEDWNVDGELVGLPVLISNPAVAFEGFVRGRGYRYRDLGREEAAGREEARGTIERFGHSTEGRAYEPWVARYLAGRLPLEFGADLREHWWRLIPLQTKLGMLELTARVEKSARHVGSARAVRAFLDGLSRKIGRPPETDPDTVRLNDLGREALLAALHDADATPDSEDGVVEEIFAQWPYRSWDQLLAKAPKARALRRLKSRLGFGQVVAQADQGTLKASAATPKDDAPGRALANHEIFGRLTLPTDTHAEAVATFPSFEAFMDSALHDPKWGYYGHEVVIGTEGHFDTHPETLTPHYGRWIARAAFNSWRMLVAASDLTDADEFPVIEFGAGNGRLARDFLDAVNTLVADSNDEERERWRTFGSRVKYRIYETSASLRDKQRALLGQDALVVEGDARKPRAALERDFPGGVRGFVVTNEVPDAFGVHKLLLTGEGRAFAVLVVPRVTPELREALDDALADRIGAGNSRLRSRFALERHPSDAYLDAGTYAAVMDAIAARPSESRGGLRAGLWFEEALVATSNVPPLAAHLARNARDHAIALASEPTGVVAYVNLHADRFVSELGRVLRAGVIVTVDYGDTTFGLIEGARRGEFPFRVYGDWQEYVPRPNDPYAAPGTQDMTADVNFTSLARAGVDAGLSVIHYGLERDITGKELPLALRGADQSTIAKFLGNPVFKVLVLGTRQGVVLDGSDASSLALFHGEERVPKARRASIGSLERALSRG